MVYTWTQICMFILYTNMVTYTLIPHSSKVACFYPAKIVVGSYAPWLVLTAVTFLWVSVCYVYHRDDKLC